MSGVDTRDRRPQKNRPKIVKKSDPLLQQTIDFEYLSQTGTERFILPGVPPRTVVGARYEVSSSISKCMMRVNCWLHARIQPTCEDDPIQPSRRIFFFRGPIFSHACYGVKPRISCYTARCRIYQDITEGARVWFVGCETAWWCRASGS